MDIEKRDMVRMAGEKKAEKPEKKLKIEKSSTGKRKGFILRYLMVVVTFALGVFALIHTTLRSYAQREDLESEEWRREALLDSVGEVFFYEMALLNSYILEGELMSIEEYFYESEKVGSSEKPGESSREEEGIKIYADYDNVAKFHMRTKDLSPGEKIEISPDELMSVGGYQISYLNPKFSLWNEGQGTPATFKFAKEIEVLLGSEIGQGIVAEEERLEGEAGDRKRVLRVRIETGYVKTACVMKRSDRSMRCDPLPKVQELAASEE